MEPLYSSIKIKTPGFSSPSSSLNPLIITSSENAHYEIAWITESSSSNTIVLSFIGFKTTNLLMLSEFKESLSYEYSMESRLSGCWDVIDEGRKEASELGYLEHKVTISFSLFLSSKN